MRFRQEQRGYSLMEMLVVLAIIGVMSLVTIPAFMNFSRAARLKSSVGRVNAELRSSRQQAITRNVQVRVTFPTGAGSNTFESFESHDRGATWERRTQPLSLDEFVFFASSTFPDVDADSDPDIVFLPNGTVVTAGNFVVEMDANIAFNQYTVAIGTTGQISTTKAHV